MQDGGLSSLKFEQTTPLLTFTAEMVLNGLVCDPAIISAPMERDTMPFPCNFKSEMTCWISFKEI